MKKMKTFRHEKALKAYISRFTAQKKSCSSFRQKENGTKWKYVSTQRYNKQAQESVGVVQKISFPGF